MRFRFEAALPHQIAAIEAVCALFRGAAPQPSAFTIAPASPLPLSPRLPLGDTTPGHANRLDLDDDRLFANLRDVQSAGGLEIDDALVSPDFTVEMETGTGKTYVYLRTIFELHRRHGLTKFVIVVPSVAIREGVRTSIERMRAHFHDLYDGVPFDWFVYDSARLEQVRDFAVAGSIRVMIATVQSLGTRTAIFRQPRESTQDIAALQWVADTRPVVIIDEPQSVDANPDGAGAQILRDMRPLVRLRYSATHARRFHPVHRLDAFDAHDQGLVKSIEIDGAQVHDADNTPLVTLLQVEAKRGHPPRAVVELVRQSATRTERATFRVDDGADLATLTGRAIYAGMRIGTVDARDGGSMQLLLPGSLVTLHPGETHGGIDPDSLSRAMIARTIRHHFIKELRNRPLGIKTLSLFFVDRVADYRCYAADGTPSPGRLARMFEEEYRRLAAHADYATLFATVPADPVAAHGGYFSADRHGRMVEYDRSRSGDLNAAAAKLRDATFDLIMKDKERLLDEAEPLRFVFSHSALREGWDNPNVFQICILRAMGGDRQRRQSIGRGLRLAVDAHGVRRRDEGLNRLTIISDEPFRAFAKGLQDEVEQALGMRLGRIGRDLFAGLRYPLPDGGTALLTMEQAQAVHDALDAAGMVDGGKPNDRLRAALADGTMPLPPLPPAAAAMVRQRLTRACRTLPVADARERGRIRRNHDVLAGHDFRELWARIAWKTVYRLDFADDALVDACARAVAAMPPAGTARVVFETGTIDMGREGVFVARTATSIPHRVDTGPLPMPDLLRELQERTDLPRAILARILIASGRLAEAGDNPTAFLDGCTVQINVAKRAILVGGIAYDRVDERWSQSLFRAEDDVDATRLVPVRHAPVDAVMVDSAVERSFVADLDDSDAIRVFAKLPRAFRIATPLGSYNPDWAIVRDTQDGPRVCLVAETKGDLNTLRDAERDRIRCGRAHFTALDVPFIAVTTLAGVLSARIDPPGTTPAPPTVRTAG